MILDIVVIHFHLVYPLLKEEYLKAHRKEEMLLSLNLLIQEMITLKG